MLKNEKWLHAFKTLRIYLINKIYLQISEYKLCSNCHYLSSQEKERVNEIKIKSKHFSCGVNIYSFCLISTNCLPVKQYLLSEFLFVVQIYNFYVARDWNDILTQARQTPLFKRHVFGSFSFVFVQNRFYLQEFFLFLYNKFKNIIQ